MIVEFTGPPCAGKSTLIRAVEEQLFDSGFPVVIRSGTEGGLVELMRALLKPKLAGWAIRKPIIAAGTHGQLLLRAAGVAMAARTDNRVVLFDEGTMKMARRLDQRLLNDSLYKALPAPDILVFVTCARELRIARCRAEDRGFIRRVSDAEAIASSEDRRTKTRQFAATRSVKLLEFDTTDNEGPAAARDVIVDAITNYRR